MRISKRSNIYFVYNPWTFQPRISNRLEEKSWTPRPSKYQKNDQMSWPEVTPYPLKMLKSEKLLNQFHEIRLSRFLVMLCTKSIRNKYIITVLLRATSRFFVRLAPKISNYVMREPDNDMNRLKSSREIILLLVTRYC